MFFKVWAERFAISPKLRRKSVAYRFFMGFTLGEREKGKGERGKGKGKREKGKGKRGKLKGGGQ
jgi:hypothetical protein